MNDKASYAQEASIEDIRTQTTPERIARIEAVVRGRQRGLTLVMENVWNPHNLAAITRTADAFGVQQLHYTSEGDFDPNEMGFKSGRRAHKWVDYIHHTDIKACIRWLQATGWHVAATILSERSTSLYAVEWATYDRLAVLVGNERNGISQRTAALADSHIKIPMRGMLESLNVSVAVGITLSEITRQRDASATDFQLNQREAAALTEDFLRRSFV